MLQVKSFKIEDGEEMSKFLQSYRLATGATIMVSEGFVVFPYEDGLPMNTSQRVINLKEELYKEEEKVKIIIHSQKVLEINLDGAEEQRSGLMNDIEELKSKDTSKEGYEKIKTIEIEIKRMDNVINQMQMSMITNQAELTNSQTEQQVYNEEIKSLE